MIIKIDMDWSVSNGHYNYPDVVEHEVIGKPMYYQRLVKDYKKLINGYTGMYTSTLHWLDNYKWEDNREY